MGKLNNKRITAYDVCLIAIGTAVVAALAQVSVPLAAGVPLTLQTFAISFIAVVLGKKSAIAALVYVVLGAVGLPVFAMFTGGFARIAGPTGGYILSYPIVALVVGWASDSGNRLKLAASLAAGVAINLGMGTIWLGAVNGLGPKEAFIGGFAPFIVIEVIKMIMAYSFGQEVRKATKRMAKVRSQ